MNRRIALLEAIENGFTKQINNYPVNLTEAKEKNSLNYRVYGNTEMVGVPNLDYPAFLEGVGKEQDLSCRVTVESGNNSHYITFTLPMPLYKVGNSIDYIDFQTQKAYINTGFINIGDYLYNDELEIYSKKSNVIYLSIPYSGKNEENCFSPMWSYNGDITADTESIGIDLENDVIFFSIAWSRLGLQNIGGIVYRIGDNTQTPLTDGEILDKVIDYLGTIAEENLDVLIATSEENEINMTLPQLSLYKGNNSITFSSSVVTNVDYFVTESEDYLITEADRNIITENSSWLILPSSILIEFKSFMQ